jgi:selenide,water dikinase
LRQLPPIEDPAVLVGTATADDAAAYRIDDQRCLLQTLDFITPIVDDPYTYGQIAAANSLSDIYAMGGRPLFALNIVCFPSRTVPLDVLSKILQGGHDKAREAGIDIIGGHSVDDAEPKYGLVVTGMVSPDRILTNAGAKPGDVLVLTKPLGSGILTTALKKGRLDAAGARKIVQVMTTLNRTAAESLAGLDVHALTDVTGFGLLGHLIEMLVGSQVGACLEASQVPVLEEVWPLARAGVFPGGTTRNRARFEPSVHWADAVLEEMKLVLADAQTSGGLLIAIAPQDVDTLLGRLSRAGTLAQAIIGEVTAEHPGVVSVETSVRGSR